MGSRFAGSIFLLLISHLLTAQMAKPAAAACGPDNIAPTTARFLAGPGTLPLPSSGNALLFVTDTYKQRIYHIQIQIAIDGRWVGMLRKRSHLSIDLSPGPHHICARLKYKSIGMKFGGVALANVIAKPGSSIYFMTFFRIPCDEGCEAMPAVFLREVNPDEGRFQIATTDRSEKAGGP